MLLWVPGSSDWLPNYLSESPGFRFERYQDLHKPCEEELPGNVQYHPFHPHHLLTPRFCRHFFLCNGCSTISTGLKYGCKECKFQLDVSCVSKIQVKIPIKGVQTYSLYHQHKLLLVHSNPLQFFGGDRCSCCRKRYRNPSYTCLTCVDIFGRHNFFIHKSCLDWIPKQVQSSFHPKHALSIIVILPSLHVSPDCRACSFAVRQIAVTCKECRLYFHITCGSRTRPGLLFNFHPHKMHYLLSPDPYSLNVCMFCTDENVGAFYKCFQCNVVVHIKCIPIPDIVEHESHCCHPLC